MNSSLHAVMYDSAMYSVCGAFTQACNDGYINDEDILTLPFEIKDGWIIITLHPLTGKHDFDIKFIKDEDDPVDRVELWVRGHTTIDLK